MKYLHAVDESRLKPLPTIVTRAFKTFPIPLPARFPSHDSNTRRPLATERRLP